MTLLFSRGMRNRGVVEKQTRPVENTSLHLHLWTSQKISSSVCTLAGDCADAARNWTRIFAMVRRFQKATAVAPRIADPAIRNAVDQRPLLATESLVEVPAISSDSDSCLRLFSEVPMTLSISGGFYRSCSMAYRLARRYLSLESV